jgi:glucose/mannose-6-phosphate isomerase
VTAETEALAVLDDGAARQRLDAHGLLARIEALPEQCDEAWRKASGFAWPEDCSRARNVVVLGMGGSAIAGDVLRSLASFAGEKPVAVVRGYDVPAFVGDDTLVVACSHSGNTEETISALEASLVKGGRAAVITTGGRLAKIAGERSLPAFVYQYDGQPRCALGYQLMALLALGERIGLLPEQSAAVKEALAIMRRQRDELAFAVPSLRNAAKQLAGRLREKVPVIIGGGVLADAAHRWKTQLNENSKSWAFWDELPEMDHNSVVGFGLPETFVRHLYALFLLPEALARREEVRYEATADELTRAGVANERIDIAGKSPLAQVLSAIYLGDFVSYYLALLNGVDPTPIDPIARVKARLAQE